MTDPATEEPGEYLVEHIRAALAEDDRVAQLDLHVRIVAGTVYIHGQVQSATQQGAVATVARELVSADVRICNETRVPDLPEPSSSEDLG